MGQPEIYELLKRRFENGDKNFYSSQEIHNMLREEGLLNGSGRNLSIMCAKLENAGFLEAKYTGKVRDWKRLWRMKR